MKLRTTFLLIAGAAALSAPAFAQDEAAEGPTGPWSGLVAAGYSDISGNTESSAFSLNTEVNYDAERWHHQLRGFAINRSDTSTIDGVEVERTTAEAYKAAVESRFDITDRTYAFGLVEYNKDRFSAYDSQTYEIVGIGRRFIETAEHILSAQVGVGAGQNDLIDGTSENEFTTRIGVDYTWNFSDNASFSQLLNYTISSSNKFTESVSELRAGVLGNLSLLLGYTIRNNSDVLPGNEKSDKFTTIAVEYAF